MWGAGMGAMCGAGCGAGRAMRGAGRGAEGAMRGAEGAMIGAGWGAGIGAHCAAEGSTTEGSVVPINACPMDWLSSEILSCRGCRSSIRRNSRKSRSSLTTSRARVGSTKASRRTM